MTTQYTKNFALALPDFRMGPWHDLVNGDFTKIDNLIYGAVSQTDVAAWQNNTAYTAGTTVLDSADATTWMCSVNHTSASTGTFAEDRVLHPTYWTQLINGFAPRGEWAHDTQYFPYDLTYQTSQGIFALCKTRHVSNSLGSIIDDEAYWSFLINFSEIGLSTAATVTYSNVSSPTLTATNVQQAIDQLENQTTALNNVNITQGTNISDLQAKDVIHESRLAYHDTWNTNQDVSIQNNTNLANSKQANLGYTPVNKAGDEMSNSLTLTHGGTIFVCVRGPNNRSVYHYLDDNNYYILLGNMSGANTLRPFRIDPSGNVYVVDSGQQFSVGGQANFNGYCAFNAYALFNAHLGVTGTINGNAINASTVVCTGAVQGSGWQCRQGLSGAVQANVVNHSWTGSEAQCWIDNTKVNTVFTSCDPRIKKDILPLDFDALSHVNQMEPVSFRYKDVSIFKDDGKRHIGFSADALAKVLPDLVYGEIDDKTSDGDVQPMGLNLIPIIAVLVKAVQELSSQVEDLRRSRV